ncbi:MAG: dermonecrotic toxin domain-containing protein [Janthinobacterium lividum]
MTTTLPCFHTHSLRNAFARQLAHARQTNELSINEAQILAALCQTPWQTSPPLRIDRLSAPGWTCHEFADALMISHTDMAITTVYLCLPLCAVERFADRHLLDLALIERYGEGDDQQVSAELLSSSPFDYWMENFLSRQQALLQSWDATLLRLPGLRGVLHDSLHSDLTRLAATLDSEPDSWVYQVTALQDATDVRQTRRLVDVALDDFCAVPSPHDTRTRLVDPQGELLSTERQNAFDDAFSFSINRLNTSFTDALGNFWATEDSQGRSRLQQAARALAHHYYVALLQGAHEQTIDTVSLIWLRSLLRANPVNSATPLRAHRIALHSGALASIELAGTFALTDSNPASTALFLFNARVGLLHFADAQALSTWLTDPAQKVLLDEAIGGQNLAPLSAMKNIEVRLLHITEPVFVERLRSIVTTQQSNLALAIAQRGTAPDEVAASLDDALDIRGLLAPALLQLRQSSRWASKVSTTSTPPATTPASAAYLRVFALQTRFSEIRASQPDLKRCLNHQIDLQLAMLGPPWLRAESIWVSDSSAPAGDDRARETLLTLVLGRLARSPATVLPDDCVITGDDECVIERLDAHLLNRLLDNVAKGAKNAWVGQFHRFNNYPQRVGATQIDAHGESLQIRQALLREELTMGDEADQANAWVRTWLRQVVDRPTRAMRFALGDQRIEVNRVNLRLPGNAFAIPLSNVIVLSLGLEPEGRVVLCSHLMGAVAFDSLADCKAELLSLLRAPQTQAGWLTLIAERFHTALSDNLQSEPQQPLQIETFVEEADYARYLQRSDETRQIFTAEGAFNRARKTRYPGALCLAYVDRCAAPLGLDYQLDEIASTLYSDHLKQLIPSWIRTASSTDVKLYLDNLQRLTFSQTRESHYLFGIQSAIGYATEHLQAALTLSFPSAKLEVSQIRVQVAEKFKSGFYFSAAAEGLISGAGGVSFPALDLSLAEYALHRAMAAPGIPIKISLRGQTPVPAGLTPDYVTELAQRLDIGRHYLSQLENKFLPGDADYAQRRTLFHRHIPLTLLDAAIEAKLKGELSIQAYTLIEALLDMPDPLARQAPPGDNYVIRPLCLLAADHVAPDRVAGVYLLGNAAQTSGPLVLLATFHTGFVFREYRDEPDLMEKMRGSGDLQDLVLQRIDGAVRSRYSHGGLTVPRFETSTGPDFEHPMPRPAQTRLTYQPVAGNVVDYLFKDSLAYLLRLARSQIVTSEQRDHAVTAGLLKQLAATGLSFANGRVALVLCAWQSAQWIRGSATALAQHEWGQAMSQFSAAIVSLIAQRTSRRERLGTDALLANTVSDGNTEFSWRFNDIPPELKVRLQEFVATDITLGSLQTDSTAGIYLDTVTAKRYAAVAGQVYQVRKLEGRWTIVGDHREGPPLRRTAQGHWEMEIRQGLAGGGCAWSNQNDQRTLQREIDAVFITQASGMLDMHRYYPGNAKKLVRAHARAQRYLERCMDALNVAPGQSSIPSTSQEVLKQFFSLTTVPAKLVNDVRRATGQILAELMDASMDTQTSPRYVFGLNKPGVSFIVASTDPKDVRRRIFLTDTFFDIPPVLRGAVRRSQRSFDIPSHFRATSLIHELSHIVSGTEDIAYLEASAPYLDMIDATGPNGQALLQTIAKAQNQALNAQTPTAELFTVLDNGVRRDITDADGPAFSLVLKTSKQKNLQDARQAFMHNDAVRQRIILANADSVALLITLLSRSQPGRP